jgi:hypothetical protein
MLRLACEMEAPITAVCATQQIDLSVWSIALTPIDWALTKDLRELFSVFAHPTKKLQASTYPTLNYAILQFLSIANKLEEKRQAWGADSPLGIACTKSIDVLNDYYHQLNNHSHCSIATILDPQFNIGVFDIVLPSSTYNCKKAKMRTNFKDCYYKY